MWVGGRSHDTAVAARAPAGVEPSVMTINVTDISRGEILHMDGDPWQVTEIASQTPSARGAAMMVKAKLRNLRTG
jgi:hypothetical protein